MTKNSIAKGFILAASILGYSASAFAGKEMIAPKDKNVVEKAKEDWITGDIGVNVVSQYVSRGLVFENQGGIIQPFGDVYIKVQEGEGFLTKTAINLGVWSSFQSRHTDSGEAVGRGTGGQNSSSTRSFYEFDFTAGIAFTFAKVLTLTPSYYTFLSPNDGFATFQGLNTTLALDDSEWLHGFALHPHATVLFELENKAGNGRDEGVYYEVGIAPTAPVGPVTFTFPVTAGFGSNDFYARDATFGYVSGSAQVSYALKFIPEKLGTWTVNGGATYYYLGSNSLREFNTEPANDVRDAGNSEWVFSGGMTLAF